MGNPQRTFFDGPDYDPALDEDRLATALGRIYVAMTSGDWLTLEQLSVHGQCSEAGAAARIRDLRKWRFGRHVIERRRRGVPKAGLWEYRLVR